MFEEINKRSEYIVSRLNGVKGVKSVSGRGLMLGIECEKPAKEVIAAAMTVGLYLLPTSFCTTRTGLTPACSLPTTGERSAKYISPRFIISIPPIVAKNQSIIPSML